MVTRCFIRSETQGRRLKLPWQRSRKDWERRLMEDLNKILLHTAFTGTSKTRGGACFDGNPEDTYNTRHEVIIIAIELGGTEHKNDSVWNLFTQQNNPAIVNHGRTLSN